MKYVEYNICLDPVSPWDEILIAKLSQIEFESFSEDDAGIKAYILENEDNPDFVQEQINEVENSCEISYQRNLIEQVNWNEEWEKNFDPINIDDKCYIRAEFHTPHPTEYEIIIQPKMSFGTGHHETTHLMVQNLLNHELRQKKVLDMGTGTGILAILAMMKGAKSAVGIDIDEWAYQNAVENAVRNKVEVQFLKGGADTIPREKYDIVLANINKNILKEDLPFYISVLKDDGDLFLSGLYDFDREDMINFAEKNGLKFAGERKRNQWISLHFTL